MRINTTILFISCIVCFVLVRGTHSASSSHLTQDRIERTIRESYYEISAYIVSYFNEKCKLALQNCLFQTQWEKVFGKERITDLSNKYNSVKKRVVSSAPIPHSNNHNRSASHHQKHARSTNEDFFSNSSYLFCQPYLVGKFCIDDYLRKTGEYGQCVNGTQGNSPHLFKKSIYKDNCKFYYTYFFDSLASSPLRHTDLSIVKFAFIYLVYFRVRQFF
jgi:hypothetical protein